MNQRLRRVVFFTLLLGLGHLGTGVHAQYPYRGPIVVTPPPSISSPQPFTPLPMIPMIPTPSLQPSFPTVGSPTVAPSPRPAATGRMSDNHRSSNPQPEEDEQAQSTVPEPYEQPRAIPPAPDRQDARPTNPPQPPDSTPGSGAPPVTPVDPAGGSRTSWLVGLGCLAVVGAYLLGRRRTS